MEGQEGVWEVEAVDGGGPRRSDRDGRSIKENQGGELREQRCRQASADKKANRGMSLRSHFWEATIHGHERHFGTMHSEAA